MALLSRRAFAEWSLPVSIVLSSTTRCREIPVMGIKRFDYKAKVKARSER